MKAVGQNALQMGISKSETLYQQAHSEKTLYQQANSEKTLYYQVHSEKTLYQQAIQRNIVSPGTLCEVATCVEQEEG